MNLSVREISRLTNMPEKTIYQRIKAEGIKNVDNEGRTKLYDKYQIDVIKNSGSIVKYVPYYVTETFYIYESKINNETQWKKEIE